MQTRTFLLLIVATLASSCRPWGLARPEYPVPAPFAELPANLSRVCVVRAEDFDSRRAFPTWDNGVLVGATRGGSHFCYIAEPGVHELLMGDKNKVTIAVTLEAGKGYFLQHQALPAAGITNVNAAWIDDATAKALIAQSSYEVITDVPGGVGMPPRNPTVAARTTASSAPQQVAPTAPPPTAPVQVTPVPR